MVTGRTCVLGSSGSGKSYAVGVLCEELCRNEIPFAIVDTEGEHTGLKERFEAIWVGQEKEVSINRGLEVAKGFEKLLGLTTLQVEVLREVKPDSDTSALDVASSLGESKPTVSRILGFLNDKRLVRTIEVRNRKLYRRLTDLPGTPSEFVPLELAAVDIERARVVPPKIKESDVRDAVKGLWEGADVESFGPFLYPVFKVELVVRRKHRQVLIDGRSGRELVF